MKNLFSLFFAISLTLSACGTASTQTVPPARTSTPTFPSTATMMLIASQTPTRFYPPTPEYPKLVTPRVTPFPTISYEDARDELSYILQTNGDCSLPCFWGIYPEQTRYEELYSILDHLGGSRFETLQENGDIRVTTTFRFEERRDIFVEFEANLQNNIVKDLKVSLLNLFDTGVSSKDWVAYNMDEILRIYGVPDSVELYFSIPYDWLSFDIRLIYNNIHTFILYSAGTNELEKYLTHLNAIFCPKEIGIDSVVMHIGKNPFNKEPDGIPLLEATGLSEQDFYKLFIENSSACLTLNQEAFDP